MSDGKLLFETKLDDSGLKSGLTKMGGLAKGLGGAIASGLAAGATAIGGIGLASLKMGIDFESAFAGVKKTVDATDEEFEVLRKGIINLSKEMPQTAMEIAGVAEAAGQLGVSNDAILDFTKTMVMLGDATNLSSEQAATSLARFANITGMAEEDYSRLGSTIVALGNNFATTEAEIVAMGMRLAGTSTQVGLTEYEIMALSTAMSSVGISAEAGGSAMSRVMQKMNSAVISSMGGINEELEHFTKVFEGTGVTVEEVLIAYEKGDEALQALATTLGGSWDVSSLEEVAGQFAAAQEGVAGFAEVAGMSAEEFSQMWKDKPTEAISAFVKGLNEIKESGGDVTQTLKDLGLKSLNEIDTLNRLAGAYDLLDESMELALQAWTENVALQEEAAQKYATTESQLLMLKNSFINLGIALSDTFLPQVNDSIKGIREAINGLADTFETDGFDAFIEALGQMLADGITAIAEAAPQFIDGGIEIMNSLINGLNSNIGAIADAAVSIGNSLLLGIGSITVSMLDLGLNILTEFINGINSSSGQLTDTGQNIISQFVEVIRTRIPELLVAGKELVLNLINGFIENFPMLMEQGSQMVLNIAQGITATIPELMTKGLESIISFGDGIIAAIPNLISSGIAIVQGIVQGIADNLPLIIENAPRLINEFANAIYSAIPELLMAGLNIIVTLGEGIINAIPTLIANIPAIIMAIVNAFTLYNWAQTGSQLITKLGEGIKTAGQNLPQIGKSLIDTLGKAIEGAVNVIINAAKTVGKGLIDGVKTGGADILKVGGELIKSFGTGISGGLSGVVSAAKVVITGVISGIKTFLSQFMTTGKELISNVGKGFTSALQIVKTAATGIINGAKATFTNAISQFATIGKDLIGGLARGITEGIGAAITAVQNVGTTIVSKAKSFFSIKSPSRKMAEEVGRPISEGIAVGIKESEFKIMDGLGKINDVMLQKMIEGHENLSYEEKKKTEERFQKLKDLNILNIGTAYEVYKELHKSQTREIEEEIKRIEEEISNTKKTKKNEARLEELKKEKELFTEKKKNLEDYSKYFAETYDKIVEEYSKAVEKIEQDTEKLAEKLKSYGEVIEVVRDAEGNVIKDKYGNDMLKLTDLDAQIRQIANYGSLLETLESRGADVDVMSKMLSMSVDDAVKYGELLMQQSDRDWDHYMNQMQTKRTLANNIAKKYYQTELDTLNKEYTQKLTENLGEITEKAEEVGQESAEKLAEGFKNNSNLFTDAVKNVLSLMENLMENEAMKSLANIQSKMQSVIQNNANAQAVGAGGMNINLYGVDYNNKNQSYDYARNLGNEIDREVRRYGG